MCGYSRSGVWVDTSKHGVRVENGLLKGVNLCNERTQPVLLCWHVKGRWCIHMNIIYPRAEACLLQDA